MQKKNNFSIISNSIIQSDNLKVDESILLIYILSLPDSWSLYKTKLEKDFKERGMSKSRFNSSWKGLINKGYIVRSRCQTDKGHFNSWNYTIVENPNLSDVSKTELSENLTVRKPTSPILGSKISTNKVNTNRENNNRYSLQDIYKLLGKLDEEIKQSTETRFNYLIRTYPEYPQLIDILSPEEISKLSNWVPPNKLNDIQSNVTHISNAFRNVLN